MKYIHFINIIILLMFITSCSSLTIEQSEQKKVGIIDACYSVLEYDAEDKEQRIERYLNQKIEQKLIDEKQKNIIKKCLIRTKQSIRWKK